MLPPFLKHVWTFRCKASTLRVVPNTALGFFFENAKKGIIRVELKTVNCQPGGSRQKVIVSNRFIKNGAYRKQGTFFSGLTVSGHQNIHSV